MLGLEKPIFSKNCRCRATPSFIKPPLSPVKGKTRSTQLFFAGIAHFWNSSKTAESQSNCIIVNFNQIQVYWSYMFSAVIPSGNIFNQSPNGLYN